MGPSFFPAALVASWRRPALRELSHRLAARRPVSTGAEATLIRSVTASHWLNSAKNAVTDPSQGGSLWAGRGSGLRSENAQPISRRLHVSLQDGGGSQAVSSRSRTPPKRDWNDWNIYGTSARKSSKFSGVIGWQLCVIGIGEYVSCHRILYRAIDVVGDGVAAPAGSTRSPRVPSAMKN